MNVLLELARRKIPILETKIETIYLDNNAASHFDTLRDSCRVYKEILKFSASSFVGFLMDYAMYSLLLFFKANLRIANLGARMVSAAVNSIINRNLVFKSKERMVKSVVAYSLLAAAILWGNTIVLEVLVMYGKQNPLLAKLITEILFFLVSWLIQKGFIFKNRI